MPHTIQPREYSRGGASDGMRYRADADDLNLLGVNRNDDGQWLNAYNGNPQNQWNRDNGFVFLAPRTSFHFSPSFLAGEFCFES